MTLYVRILLIILTILLGLVMVPLYIVVLIEGWRAIFRMVGLL